jgi:hypothetical protein
MVLGVGAVLGLAGQALAQGSFSRGRDDSRGFSRGRDGFRGGSDSRDGSRGGSYGRDSFRGGSYSRDSFRGGSYGRDSFRGGFDGRSPFVNRGFTGGFSVGYVESPRYYASPRVVAPWSLGYGASVYVAPPCGMTGRVFVTPQCSVRRPVFVAPFFPQHRYEQPTWRYRR